MPVAGVPPNADPEDRWRAEGEGLKAEGRRRTGANAEPGGWGLRASCEQRQRE